MSESVKTFSVGQARITQFNIGDIYLPLEGRLNTPEGMMADHEIMPINNFLIEHNDLKILIDAGLYAIDGDSVYYLANYEPPVGLTEQLALLNIQPEEIDHVVITHRHWDHFNGTTYEQNGEFMPQFPNATHYLGQPDWEKVQETLEDSESLESQTLSVLHKHGILHPVDGDYVLTNDVEILAAPGETVGHQIIKLQSEGESILFVGDLYHHPIEFQNHEWKVNWANPELTLDSRKRLIDPAAKERALIAATHISEIGRIEHGDSGIVWTAL